jgi:hypothetical protein
MPEQIVRVSIKRQGAQTRRSAGKTLMFGGVQA